MTERAWIENVLRPFVVAVMIGCVALSWVGLLALARPGWNGAYLVVLCFLAAVEAFVAHRLLRTRLHRLDSRWRYRAAELFGWYFIVQVAENLASGRGNPFAGMPSVEPGTVVSWTLVASCWLMATLTARDLDEVGRLPEDFTAYVPPAEGLAKRFFSGGVLLLIGAGLSRVELTAMFSTTRPPVGGLVLNVLLYFLLGTLMLGQMQYTTLSERWRRQDARVAEGLGGRWVRLTLAFLGVVAVVALLLPTGYTVGILDLLAYALGILLAGLQLLISLLLAPILWLLSLIDFGGPGGEGRIMPQPRIPPRPRPQGSGGNLLDLFRSVLFWVVALGIVFYMARSYVRNRPGASAGRLGFIGRLLGGLWRAMWGRLRGYAKAARTLAKRRPAAGPAGAAPARGPGLFRRAGSLSPREQVLYYYLDTVRRAGERGHPRRATQTPGEYRAALEPHLPEAGGEMAGLTEAFVVARYSPHEVDAPTAGEARSRWERVRDALKGLGRGG